MSTSSIPSSTEMPEGHQPEATRALRAVRLVHTLVWAIFAGCIVALPVAAYLGHFRLAVLLMAIVLVGVGVLFAHHFRCPLTDVAARYTSDRREAPCR